MKAVLITLLALVALALARPEYDLSADHKSLYAMYLRDYKVELKPEDHAHRYEVFSKNVDKINELNAAAKAAGKNTRFAINKFSLMSPEEFRAVVRLSIFNYLIFTVPPPFELLLLCPTKLISICPDSPLFCPSCASCPSFPSKVEFSYSLASDRLCEKLSRF